ncbi:hypothetical protein FRC19_008796 [Serendipita sp. 401]|nr:hypothetical protein FRC19_008796 [Serendipita sp. 401]
MVFHTLIWQIHSVVVNAVLVSLLGLLVGPTFPLVLDIATNPNTKQKPGAPSPLPIFAPEVQLTGLAIGASCGAMGAGKTSFVALL